MAVAVKERASPAARAEKILATMHPRLERLRFTGTLSLRLPTQGGRLQEPRAIVDGVNLDSLFEVQITELVELPQAVRHGLALLLKTVRQHYGTGKMDIRYGDGKIVGSITPTCELVASCLN